MHCRQYRSSKTKATNSVRQLLSNFLKGTVPPAWRAEYVTPKDMPLGVWMADLAARVKVSQSTIVATRSISNFVRFSYLLSHPPPLSLSADTRAHAHTPVYHYLFFTKISTYCAGTRFLLPAVEPRSRPKPIFRHQTRDREKFLLGRRYVRSRVLHHCHKTARCSCKEFYMHNIL